jgi:MerR family transcriptional regulator, heat shock protein HspR
MTERDATTPVYSIAVVAELVGIPEATLRLFERKGLLRPSRTEGGTRRYSDDDLARLRRVAGLREKGINLAGIGRVLDLEDENQGLRDELGADDDSHE